MRVVESELKITHEQVAMIFKILNEIKTSIDKMAEKVDSITTQQVYRQEVQKIKDAPIDEYKQIKVRAIIAIVGTAIGIVIGKLLI